MRGRARVGGGVTAALVVLFVLPAPGIASASSSGTITRAQVSADRTQANVAGTATRANSCEERPEESPELPEEPEGELLPPGWQSPPIQPESPPWECGWIAYATVGPGSSPADCDSPSRSLSSIGSGVQLIWSSEELTGPGSRGFDLEGLQLEYGSAAPLLCLAAVESVFDEEIECEEGGEPCPPYAVRHRTYQLDSALLEPPTPVSKSEEAPTSGSLQVVTPPTSTVGPMRSRQCRTVKQKYGAANSSPAKGPLGRASVVSPRATQSKLCLSPRVPARQALRSSRS